MIMGLQMCRVISAGPPRFKRGRVMTTETERGFTLCKLSGKAPQFLAFHVPVNSMLI